VAGARLAPEAQRAFGDANLAFVLGQTEDALQYFQEVIRMEPKHIPVRGLTLQAKFRSYCFPGLECTRDVLRATWRSRESAASGSYGGSPEV